MTGCLFARLPLELIASIFTHLGVISDVVHLAQVSQCFNGIWRDNAGSICSSIMPRSITCFQDAEVLLKTQQRSPESQPQEIFTGSTSEAALLSARSLRRSASVVARACSFFEAHTHPRRPSKLPSLTEFEERLTSMLLKDPYMLPLQGGQLQGTLILMPSCRWHQLNLALQTSLSTACARASMSASIIYSIASGDLH